MRIEFPLCTGQVYAVSSNYYILYSIILEISLVERISLNTLHSLVQFLASLLIIVLRISLQQASFSPPNSAQPSPQ